MPLPSCRFRARKILAATLVAAAALLIPSSALADFTVNTTADHANDPALCTPPSDCTLREAIAASNLTPATTDTITVPAGHYKLINQAMTQVETPMTFQGAGMGSTIIDADGRPLVAQLIRILNASEFGVTPTPMAVQVQDMTLRGVTNTDGAAVLSFSGLADTLTLTRVAVVGNAGSTSGAGSTVLMTTGAGGGLTITDSTIAGNQNLVPGGGNGATVEVFGGANLKIERSTIANNATRTAPAIAIGGINASTATSVSITNSTISGNTSEFGYTILDNTSPGITNFSYNTIVGNTPGPNMSVLRRGATSGWTFKGNIVSGNTLFGPGANCQFSGAGLPASQGLNFDSGTSCKFENANDHQSTAVAVGPLQDNGGPTPTHALPTGSAAIDAGGIGGCTAIGGAALSVDQRGAARPFGPACDSGAYEFNPSFDASLPKTDTGAGADTTAPTLTAASLKPSKFKVDRKGAPEVATVSKKGKGKGKGKKASPKGTTLSYTLSEDARVLVTVQRLPAAAKKKGAKKGAKASKGKSKGKGKGKGKAKGKAPETVGSFAVPSVAGPNAHRFSGRIGKKALRPGKYRALLVATDAAGNASAQAQVSFTVVAK